LGLRLRNRGGPISARLRVQGSRASGSRIVHIGEEPPFASGDGTTRDAPRSGGRFRLSEVPGRSSTPTACTVPPRFRFVFSNVLNFRLWPKAEVALDNLQRQLTKVGTVNDLLLLVVYVVFSTVSTQFHRETRAFLQRR
jgi:hypothetical protein